MFVYQSITTEFIIIIQVHLYQIGSGSSSSAEKMVLEHLYVCSIFVSTWNTNEVKLEVISFVHLEGHLVSLIMSMYNVNAIYKELVFDFEAWCESRQNLNFSVKLFFKKTLRSQNASKKRLSKKYIPPVLIYYQTSTKTCKRHRSLEGGNWKKPGGGQNRIEQASWFIGETGGGKIQ